MNFRLSWLLCLVVFLYPSNSSAQKDTLLTGKTLSGLKWRNIGPAFCAGRIADIAIHPQDEHTWYVAVGSGGVWKTENSGTTWKSLFDGQKSYSIGCITIDTENPHVIWVGTGENVGGRHVGYGDGVYKSVDGGSSWKHMGLEKSEHISEIIVHPENSDVIMVAAQGPLWSKGGERGFYLSEDGGNTWERTLGDEEWTGVTDIALDPRDANVLYAATWQRHRTVAAYMGGGPNSGIHKSLDGGRTWKRLSKGLPSTNMGKIGIAVSPQNPDKIYAAIELDRTKGGVYMSTDRGASWKKQSNAVSGATGPHYYQELYASPHKEGTLYLMDVRIQISTNDGKTFSRLPEQKKHSDNHAIAFRIDEPDYLLIGTDAGIYESFDHASTWRFIDNMPITQYYKVAVDDAEPFYFVYGGTQDNGSHGGPSRTDKDYGIMNQDWFKTLFADGHQSATEPGNPDIMYAETQQGGIHRIDRTTGEQVYIQPQAGPGDAPERFNWDAPILVSAHSPARLYFASQRVWRSDDRGDSWTPISADLTRNEERLTLPIMGKVQSWDNAWDVKAMSNYNTITSLAESPINESILYAATDDGIIQRTKDGGQTWSKLNVGTIKGIPERAFVNDIRADLHDENTVYACLDHHKSGDFSPYLIKSTDGGKSWKMINDGLGERNLIWRTVQDHVDPNLVFAATETGVYVSFTGGGNWHALKGGLPTIPLRDITIQRRENDLVAASFGRGFFILDDYSLLRYLKEETLAQEATLFPVKDAFQYKPRYVDNFYGHNPYIAKNPPYGAIFTYHIGSNHFSTTSKSERIKAEKTLAKEGKDIPFPGWEALEEEANEVKSKVYIVIRDEHGAYVNRLDGKAGKGIHRINWDLRYAPQGGITMSGRSFSRGLNVSPGTYSAQLHILQDGKLRAMGQVQPFEVKRLYPGALPGVSGGEVALFRDKMNAFQQDMTATSAVLANLDKKMTAYEKALARTSDLQPALIERLHMLKNKARKIRKRMNGNSTKEEVGEISEATPRSMMFVGYRALGTSYGPTEMHRKTVDLGIEKLKAIKSDLSMLQKDAEAIEEGLKKAGAPWIEGQGLIEE